MSNNLWIWHTLHWRQMSDKRNKDAPTLKYLFSLCHPPLPKMSMYNNLPNFEISVGKKGDKAPFCYESHRRISFLVRKFVQCLSTQSRALLCYLPCLWRELELIKCSRVEKLHRLWLLRCNLISIHRLMCSFTLSEGDGS